VLRVNDSTHTLISYFLLEDSLKGKMVHIHKIIQRKIEIKNQGKTNLEKYDTYKICVALWITKTNLHTT